MTGDIFSGRYGLTSPIQSALFALNGNSVQSSMPIRTNAEIPFIGSLQNAAASLVSGDLTYVAVPVDIGQPIAKISMLVGATAASTPTHSWAALYSGVATTAKILGKQSADGETAAIAANGRFDFTLPEKYIIQPADAPFGYILAGLSVTGSGVPSLISGTIPTACQKAWFTGTPLWGATYSSALGAEAPASITLASASALASPPIVALW